jgi:hypothetical protein
MTKIEFFMVLLLIMLVARNPWNVHAPNRPDQPRGPRGSLSGCLLGLRQGLENKIKELESEVEEFSNDALRTAKGRGGGVARLLAKFWEMSIYRCGGPMLE